MTMKAIGVLRSTADECARQARRAKDIKAKAELFDIAAEWHYLAGQAEKLFKRETQIESAEGLRQTDSLSFVWTSP
jgi:hypothetical protein